MTRRSLRSAAWLAAVALGVVCGPALALEGAEPANLGATLGLWTLAPFVAILLAIAVLPVVATHWWEHNRNKALVAAVCAVPIAVYLVAGHGHTGVEVLLEKSAEYASFIVLLGALFAITGGIHVKGSLSGTPLVNTAILAIGAVLASLIGTTGASVLLIRPLLRANEARRNKVHLVIFFIFIVSNCGGLLTPLGDPPLFLGFQKGVPFLWTLGLWKPWLFVNLALLVVFNVWDQRALAAEELARPGSQLEEVQHHAPLRIEGGLNFVFLLGVVAVIFCSGQGVFSAGAPWPFGVQEVAMIALSLAAWRTTPSRLRAANRFSWTPIVEVAVLFAGIFVCMAPALLILNAWGQGSREVLGASFALHRPWEFYWSTGLLSSFLDNAPTYLTFGATAAGMHGVPVEGPRYLGDLLATGAPAQALMVAISCGAVMMGANTYIGNGPNFMVKAIAEENGVVMRSFFGYMLYSACILLPLFSLVTLIFFG
mgnify:CR=1 FL=1